MQLENSLLFLRYFEELVLVITTQKASNILIWIVALYLAANFVRADQFGNFTYTDNGASISIHLNFGCIPLST